MRGRIPFGSDEVGRHVPLDEGTDEYYVRLLVGRVVTAKPHITADALVSVVVGYFCGLAFVVSEGLSMRFADVMMIRGFDGCFIGCEGGRFSAGGRHMRADSEFVMRIVMRYPRIGVLLCEVIQSTAGDDANDVPTLVVVRGLEVTHHTFDDFLGNLTVTGELTSLALGDTTGNEVALEVAHRLGLTHTINETLTSLCGEVGCIVDGGCVGVSLDEGDETLLQQSEYLIGVADDGLIAV